MGITGFSYCYNFRGIDPPHLERLSSVAVRVHIENFLQDQNPGELHAPPVGTARSQFLNRRGG